MSRRKKKIDSQPIPYINDSLSSWTLSTKNKIEKSIENENIQTVSTNKHKKNACARDGKGNHDSYPREKFTSKVELFDSPSQREAYNERLKLIIEIFKYFTHPSRRNASYISETELVSYPNPCKIEFRRGGVTSRRLRFTNSILEPVFVTIYKIMPHTERLRVGNASRFEPQRVPVGLSYEVVLVYKDGEGEESVDRAKIVFVASRNTATPCFQVCDIDLDITPLDIKNM
ncbi:hypothetical protein EVAR_32934_1 [Eumeta japonica]|uniref:Uncharacterized protein n=1 Tax=Eumeta variegata TaxID=151549 RepID=A0A4C1X4E2_EUMVA|nr:hypothetical protein EVAR_32934_1 [Eumeta japonica]